MGIALMNAITGILNFQKALDVVGNNISNISTPGYKKVTLSFKEMLCQNLEGASAPGFGVGGTNPLQIGLGAAMGSSNTIFTQGLIDTTGRPTDVAITGPGFFVINNENGVGYTRNGSFTVDVDGNMVDSDGNFVQGWMANNGTINTSESISNVIIPVGEATLVRATTQVTYTGNLDASRGDGDAYTTEKVIFDSLGKEHTLALTCTKQVPPDAGIESQWNWTATIDGVAVGGPFIAAYLNDGTYDAANSEPNPVLNFAPGDGAAPMAVNVDLTTTTQFSTPGLYSFVASAHDGFKVGVLQSFTIDKSGLIIGQFSNGHHQQVGQLAMADFVNPEGLLKVGAGIYKETANSGVAQIGPPLTGSRGTLTSGALEMSNVDLSTEFTKMIISQRAFQANSRLVSVMDQVLEEMANLRR